MFSKYQSRLDSLGGFPIRGELESFTTYSKKELRLKIAALEADKERLHKKIDTDRTEYGNSLARLLAFVQEEMTKQGMALEYTINYQYRAIEYMR